MSYTKTIRLELTERATVELETEFGIRAGMPTRRWDVDPGWPAELDSMTYNVTEVEFESGTTIGFDWLNQRGFLPLVERLINPTKVEERLGCLDDYLYEE